MPTNTHKNLGFTFLVLLFGQILFIYGTENFSRLKCRYKEFQTCEKCDENSKIFYEIENKKFCSRCTLGYLSYYFSSQTMKEVNFYCTDIIFDSTEFYAHNKRLQISWNFINELVNDKINKRKLILLKRKAANKSFDLFLLVNEILTKMNQMPLEKNKCLKCSNPRFNLIKCICGKRFICISCFDKFCSSEKTNCEICQNIREIEVSWLGNKRPQNKYFGKCIPRPGVGARIFNLITNGTLQILTYPPIYQIVSSLGECEIEILDIYYVVLIFTQFVGVSEILEKMFSGVNSNPNISQELQKNIYIVLKGLAKMITTWINIVVGLYLSNGYELGCWSLSLITVPTIWYIFCKFRIMIHSYVENEVYEFL